MYVDEAGCHGAAGGIDLPLGGDPGKFADGYDALPADRDIRRTACRPGAVVQCPATDHQVGPPGQALRFTHVASSYVAAIKR